MCCDVTNVWRGPECVSGNEVLVQKIRLDLVGEGQRRTRDVGDAVRVGVELAIDQHVDEARQGSARGVRDKLLRSDRVTDWLDVPKLKAKRGKRDGKRGIQLMRAVSINKTDPCSV